MANPEHLEIVRCGAESIRKFREGAGWYGLDLENGDLTSANIKHDTIGGGDYYTFADLSNADFHGSRLQGARLNFVHLERADFRDADLTGADLEYARLRGANLTGVNLENANLRSADLRRCNLSKANLKGATIAMAVCEGTCFADVDLSEVIGVDCISHEGPSSIGIDTIYKSKGKIPESFLKGAGVPDSFITYARSLVVQALAFHTCFISFTEADDLFAEKLYNDLQAAGIRCWRWKEDAKWGKTLMRSIDEAIHIYDKLVVVCSEDSLKSAAVIREIERALQKEDELTRQGKEGDVLFPVRLDDYIFTTWEHHRKADLIAKHIGDLRQWKEFEKYRNGLARLIGDLKV